MHCARMRVFVLQDTRQRALHARVQNIDGQCVSACVSVCALDLARLRSLGYKSMRQRNVHETARFNGHRLDAWATFYARLRCVCARERQSLRSDHTRRLMIAQRSSSRKLRAIAHTRAHSCTRFHFNYQVRAHTYAGSPRDGNVYVLVSVSSPPMVFASHAHTNAHHRIIYVDDVDVDDALPPFVMRCHRRHRHHRAIAPWYDLFESIGRNGSSKSSSSNNLISRQGKATTKATRSRPQKHDPTKLDWNGERLNARARASRVERCWDGMRHTSNASSRANEGT